MRGIDVNQFNGRQWLWTMAVLVLCILTLPGCSPREVPGTYEVEIEIMGVPTTLKGTLILAAEFLEIPPLAETERAQFAEWFVDNTLDANSCFILESTSNSEDASTIVQVFETRLRGNEIALPIEIFHTPTHRIEIVDLKFFANTTGGDVILYDGDQQREGRIGGVRSGAPSAARCQEGLEAFRAELRASVSS
jgi:hypothetical protein